MISLSLIPALLSFAGNLFNKPGGNDQASIIGFVLTLASIVLGIIAYLGLVYVIKDGVQMNAALAAGAKQFFPYLWLSILSTLVLAGGFVMAIVPGIIFSIWFSFSIFAFLVDGKRGLEAVLKSKEYVFGYFWLVFGRLFMLIIIAFPILIFTSFIAKGDFEVNVVMALFQAFFTPFALCYSFILYSQLKNLKPDIAANPVAVKKGFYIFSAVLGILAGVALLVTALVFIPKLAERYNQQLLENNSGQVR